MVLLLQRPVNSTFPSAYRERGAWLKPLREAADYTAILRCLIGEPNVRLAAASMMVLVSSP